MLVCKLIMEKQLIFLRVCLLLLIEPKTEHMGKLAVNFLSLHNDRFHR